MNKPSFYLLDRQLSDDSRRIEQESHHEHCFIFGAPLESNFVPPVVYQVDLESGGSDLPTTFLPQPIFSEQFVEHLGLIGVANLEVFPVVINDGQSESQISGYMLVNVLGMIACADLALSKFDEFDGVYDFDELVIDPARARGPELFRLAEAADYIIVSGRLAERIEVERFKDIRLVPLRISPPP
jgi:hypothetical protein